MNMLSKLRKEVGQGGYVPPGWKMAWYDPCHRAGVYYPAPLHWVVRGLRECNYRLQIALRAPVTECGHVFEMEPRHGQHQRTAEEYARGYLAGWHECFVMCLEEVEKELKYMDDVRDFGSLLAEVENRLPRSN